MTQPSFSLADYQALCSAIATGATEVQFADRKVVYRELKHMLQVKSMMEKSLGVTKKKTNLYPTCSKGL